MADKKILIVEDETIIGMDIASRLEKNGYEVVGLAVDDTEVMDYLSSVTPDLMLMDISLKSAVDGIELVKEIHETTPVPVIYLTSYSDSATIKRSMETGPYGYIIKPFTTQTLLTTISLSFVRIELEKNLNEKNDMLRGILNSTLDGIALTDSESTILRTNSSFCRIFGIPDKSRGLNIEKLVPGFKPSDKLRSMHRAFAGNTEKRLIVSSSACEQGHIITVTDVTEIETFRTALDMAEKRFTTIFKKKFIPAVLVTSPDCEIYDYNEKFEEIYGSTGITGRNLSDFVGRDTVQLLMKNAAGHNPFHIERSEQKKADGTVFFAEISGNRTEIDNKEYYLIDINDITEKIKIEQMEKELKMQMIQTNKMTALGTLVSGVAHELNNPNNFIMFNSTLLQDYLNDIFCLLDTQADKTPGLMLGSMKYEEAKSDILQLLSGSIKGSERIRDIVLDLKGFARQDTPINKDIINLENAINSAVRILHHKIGKCTDNFSVLIDKNLPKVAGNMQKLEQVFLNIIINALEALSAKNQPVTVECRQEGSFVCAEVKDGGSGIPENVLERITEPFFTTKQSVGGTGLGLAIVYSIIKDHNGQLNITSEPGKGTSVKVCIPVSER